MFRASKLCKCQMTLYTFAGLLRHLFWLQKVNIEKKPSGLLSFTPNENTGNNHDYLLPRLNALCLIFLEKLMF